MERLIPALLRQLRAAAGTGGRSSNARRSRISRSKFLKPHLREGEQCMQIGAAAAETRAEKLNGWSQPPALGSGFQRDAPVDAPSALLVGKDHPPLEPLNSNAASTSCHKRMRIWRRR